MFVGILRKRIELKSWQMTLALTLFSFIFMNFRFWQFLYANTVADGIVGLPLMISLSVISFVVTFLIYSLAVVPYLGRFLISFIMISNAIVMYYMTTTNMIFDKLMMLNLFGTDFKESSDYITLSMVAVTFAAGVLPVLFYHVNMKVRFSGFFRELKWRALMILASVILLLIAIAPMTKKVSFFFRTHKEIKHYLVPLNYLDASKVIVQKLTKKQVVLEEISRDAVLTKMTPQKTVIFLVIGETARAQSFSLNGYERKTNIRLEKEDIINYKNFYSCGTATAMSLPCIFSHKPRATFSPDDILKYENLIDFYKRVGYTVIWRDNNTGCKNICDRVLLTDYRSTPNPKYCVGDSCFDDILLDGLSEVVDQSGDKVLVVFHQLGSHGPAYYSRYPDEYKIFKDPCMKKQLSECTREQVIDAYDNSITYTDAILGKMIDLLKTKTDANTAMIYFSDHGESTGEKGLYLHGYPYWLAPDQQIHIPMVHWFSPQFLTNYGVDVNCLKKNSENKYSHDNIFHSMLGLVGIQTSYYDQPLDLFAGCRTN